MTASTFGVKEVGFILDYAALSSVSRTHVPTAGYDRNMERDTE